MKKRMYVGLFMLLFCMIFAVTALPITAKADMVQSLGAHPVQKYER